MILRLLWPSAPTNCQLPDHDGTVLLLGALLHCRQHSQQVLVAAVVALYPLKQQEEQQQLHRDAAAVQQQLASSAQRVQLPGGHTATVAVLGSWSPQQQHKQQQQPPLLGDYEFQPGSDVWLCLRGAQQPLHDTLQLQLGRPKPRVWAPAVDTHHSRLPHKVQSVQVCVYSVPAQHPGYGSVRLPSPQRGPQAPWVVRDTAAVSLSALMHMLQDAHAAVGLRQQQQQQKLQDLRLHAVAGSHACWQQLAAAAVTGAAGSSGSPPPRRLWAAGAATAWLSAAAARFSALLHQPSVGRQQSVHSRGRPTCAAAAAGGSNSSLLDADEAFSAAGGRLQFVVQHLLGVLLALNLLLHQGLLLASAAAAAHWLQDAVLQPHIDWLTQAHPAGIKLHVELSLLLGTAAQAALDLASAAYTHSWHALGPAALHAQALAAAVGGASWGCAAAADLLLLLLAPLELLYVACAAGHRLQLRCLAATWRLIRGRQKVRRFSQRHRPQQQQQQQQPADPAVTNSSPAGDEVSVEQLIVGVLLFTPLLGLLPTMAAWYLSMCALQAVLQAARLVLLALGSWMQLRPLHVLAARWSQPQRFPGQLVVRPLTAGAAPAGSGRSSLGSHLLLTTAPGGSSSSSSRGRRVGVERGDSASPPVSHLSIFWQPLSYGEVLAHSIRQQQDLLWFVTQQQGQPRGGGRSSLGSSLVGWLRDVATGHTWGLRLLSTANLVC